MPKFVGARPAVVTQFLEPLEGSTVQIIKVQIGLNTVIVKNG